MQNLNKLLLLTAVVLVSACGVKGPPIPPDPPAYLGRGKPSYQEQDKGRFKNPTPGGVGVTSE